MTGLRLNSLGYSVPGDRYVVFSLLSYTREMTFVSDLSQVCGFLFVILYSGDDICQ